MTEIVVSSTYGRGIAREAIRDNGGLAGLKQIAAALGVSRQRADVLSRGETFPEHVGYVNESRAWLLGDVLEWNDARVKAREER